MAIGTTLPPRAYTREILTAAFNWLQTQPDSVRTKATTPDALVGLYTRAQRFGSVAEADAPVSSQNFMSDLKNLAEGLKAFDSSKVQFSPTEAAVGTSHGLTSSPNSQMAHSAHSVHANQAPQAAQAAQPVQAAAPVQAPQPVPAKAPSVAAAASPAQPSVSAAAERAPLAAAMASTSAKISAPLASAATSTSQAPQMTGLNEKALSMLQEVQMALNLSSETEAANMMIALAYKSLKTTLLS